MTNLFRHAKMYLFKIVEFRFSLKPLINQIYYEPADYYGKNYLIIFYLLRYKMYVPTISLLAQYNGISKKYTLENDISSFFFFFKFLLIIYTKVR